jgi:N-acetylneuraminate synthase
MRSAEITIGGRLIGDRHPPFVIAELGYNFRTVDEALASVDAAAAAGVDAIKIQTFRAETLTTRTAEFPPEAGGGNQHDEFRRYEIDEDTHRRIFERARDRGIVPLSTPSHADDVDLLERVGSDAFKVGSDDLTNLPLIDCVARRGRPILLSTGMATLAETGEAIETIRAAGNQDLIVLHCVSNYPVRDATLLNLRAIATIGRTFDVLTGYSDHTTTLTAAICAVALGAVVIERHFVLDRSVPVPDAFFSSDPIEMAELARVVKEAYEMRGDGLKVPAATETGMRHQTRKGLVARRDIARGSAIEADDVVIKRPGGGISPRDYGKVIGRVAQRDIAADEIITWDLV